MPTAFHSQAVIVKEYLYWRYNWLVRGRRWPLPGTLAFWRKQPPSAARKSRRNPKGTSLLLHKAKLTIASGEQSKKTEKSRRLPERLKRYRKKKE